MLNMHPTIRQVVGKSLYRRTLRKRIAFKPMRRFDRFGSGDSDEGSYPKDSGA